MSNMKSRLNMQDRMEYAKKNPLQRIVEHPSFQCAILAVILFNSVLFGLQTSRGFMQNWGTTLLQMDQFCLWVFVAEIVLKLFAYGMRFPRDPWNVFDFLIVAVSFVPDMGMFSSLRLFRVLRVFKLVSGVRHMRVILSAIVRAIPGVTWASMLLGLIYYVYGIIATNLYGEAFPDWFGSLGKSCYSLFQIMTLESWSMGIARPVIKVFPYAWIFFVSYILFSSFIVLNIVVGIVLTSISDSEKNEPRDKRPEGSSHDELYEEISKLESQLKIITKLLSKKKTC